MFKIKYLNFLQLSFVLTGAAFFYSTNQHHQIPLTHCLPYTRLPKMSNHYILTLKMANAMSVGTDNSQHSTKLIPKSQSCTLYF
jgi:hypothetical protein